VSLHVPAGPPVAVLANPAMMEELFSNLVDNAIKYNRPGGKVEVRFEQQEGSLRAVVEDSGIGIPASHQPYVFDRFYRVDKSRSRKTGGTGLGLAIVKHVAQVHGAQVELTSTEGQGTTITVTFA
jgi:two-component system phosphate regulon sensor histidine kinase PhoR